MRSVLLLRLEIPGLNAKSEKEEPWVGECYEECWRFLTGCYCYMLLKKRKRQINDLLVLGNEGSGLQDVE